MGGIGWPNVDVVNMVGGGGQMLSDVYKPNKRGKIHILPLKCCRVLQLPHDLGMR